MRVITRNYSTYADPATGVQFRPVVVADRADPSFGCFVAAAEVTEDQAEKFEDRQGFEVLSEAEYAQLTQTIAVPEPTQPNTGDPLMDLTGGSAPPPPPGTTDKAAADKAAADKAAADKAAADKAAADKAAAADGTPPAPPPASGK